MLEKAFAKLYGSYGALEGGWVHDALVDLTGGVAETADIRAEADGAFGGAAFWSRLLSHHQRGHLLGAGSPAGADSEVSDGGIVLGHAYAVLQVAEAEGLRLVELANPHATRATGSALLCPGASPLWTPRLGARLDVTR
jgi:hypothetical protein